MSSNPFDDAIDRRNGDSVAWSRYGSDVLPFWVADMDFRAPQEIIEAIKKRADHGVFGYGDGYPNLRQLYAARVERLFKWKIAPDQIWNCAGILPILYFIICHLVKQDESVLLFTPAYPPFFKLINQSGRKLIEFQLVEKREDSILSYEIDFDSLAKNVSPNTKVLVLSSPCNPVGKVFSRSELEELTTFCLDRGIIIISDEIHSELVLDGKHVPTATISREVAQNTITLSGPSKTFNLPGLKIGHCIIENPNLRKMIFGLGQDAVADVSPISAAAALAAYEQCDYWKEGLLQYLKANRDYLIEFFKQNFPKAAMTCPTGTYLVWIDMGAYKTDKSPFELALTKGKVAFGNGKNFGAEYEDYIRISLACPRGMLMEGLEKLKSSFQPMD